jgi:Fic family protein
MEEAITSSQMEGAATTRDGAKAMIRSRRPPRDRSERMILNNFLTMQRIRELRQQQLTPQLVLDLHRLVTEEAQEALCRFANGETPKVFIHPVLRAVTLHFWLAYGHPFSDGNGRTARALFYSAMLHQDYWLFEFISISSVINKARGHYESSFLLSESDDNDLTYFLLAQVKVILQATDSLNAYLERKAGFRHTVLSHQSCYGVSHQTARSDLQKLSAREPLIAGKDGRREVFRVPEDLAARLPRR